MLVLSVYHMIGLLIGVLFAHSSVLAKMPYAIGNSNRSKQANPFRLRCLNIVLMMRLPWDTNQWQRQYQHWHCISIKQALIDKQRHSVYTYTMQWYPLGYIVLTHLCPKYTQLFVFRSISRDCLYYRSDCYFYYLCTLITGVLLKIEPDFPR